MSQVCGCSSQVRGCAARTRRGAERRGITTTRGGQRSGVVSTASSSPAEYEGDLSTSLLLGLTDEELENLASEYEYDMGNGSSARGVSFEEEEEVEDVDLFYDGLSNEEAEAESKEFALSLAEALDEVKVQDIVLLHVGPCVSWCTYFVVASVFSRPQLEAALHRLVKAAEEKHGRKLVNTERPGKTEWECIDFGDVVIHVMTPRQREKYDLEGYYSKAELTEYKEGKLVAHGTA
ncbi:ribosomal silencing factor RsfS [Chloropicon primus]|uniref:Ribosomal silencing factor RsfS n=1 Tax=Chloropicon primus TaxID=1764295 RepID=A0A5B8MB58_9CHLO|nr:ribosomal silencing factor RsfS [Chloropicon primus]UPQ96832.1 ribosomal silencing factor RsfS [Chloropicon primus]|eukprot:QDZ17616.1 ribosomal silencing factor RsfS [Chloropicon primus]